MFAGVIAQGFEDSLLIIFFERGFDGRSEVFGLIDKDIVTNRRGFLFEPHRRLNGKEKHGRHQENADPKAFGFGAFGEFAPGDEHCVFHRKEASFASGPTKRTKTSCSVGSDWLKLRRRILRSKQS